MDRSPSRLLCPWDSPGKKTGVGCHSLLEGRASLVAQLLKNLPTMQKTWVQYLGWEDPLEKEIVTTPVFLPGESHGQRSLMGYSL